MGRNLIIAMALGAAAMISTFSCSKNSDDAVVSSKKLYIATGLCYSGTGFTAPSITDVGQLVSRLDISSRAYEVVHDYGNLADEDINTYANGITDGGDGFIYIAVENPTSTGNRRIDKIARAAFGARTVWQPSTLDLSAGVLRGIARADDDGVLVGRTTSIERYDATPQNRDLDFNVSWGNNSLGLCVTNNTRITDMISLPKVLSTDQIGKYIYAHSAAGQMDIGVISKDGSNLAARCLANAPGGALLTEAATANAALNETLSANATPTSLVYISTGAGTGKLLVAYSSSAANGAQAAAASLGNALVMYDFTENTVAGETATVTNGTVLYNDVYFFGVTSMAFDPSANMLYVAAAKNQNPAPEGYNIERFSINLTTPGATRVVDSDNSSFEEPNSFTKCPTSMFVGE